MMNLGAPAVTQFGLQGRSEKVESDKDFDTIDTLARTLWGEARGCGAPGMRHVASVILNRAASPRWWGHNIRSVCLQPWQFSCHNAKDPNRAKLLAVTTANPEFKLAVRIAQDAAAGLLADETGGADSYYARSMSAPPVWAATARRTFADGWHVFFRTIGEHPRGSHPDVRNVGADALNAAELARITTAPVEQE